MNKTLSLGLDQALKITLDRVQPLPTVRVELLDGLGHALAADIVAKVDSPSIDASMKDGFAVISEEIEAATASRPVRLKLIDMISAGEGRSIHVLPGTAVRVLTGAKIPIGADAVVSEEFTETDGDTLTVSNHAKPGRNILPKGSDVATGEIVCTKGSVLSPGIVGMLAAAGHSRIPVVKRPTVAVVATGDEVVAPGQSLPEGKLYASNMTTLGGWCRRYGFQIQLDVVKDKYESIYALLKRHTETADAIVTSGGAWTGDRDLVAKVLDRLGWQKAFHRIRIGPGKAVGFGVLHDKPVFILPGGPPSNLMGFLQIALPGLLRLAGHKKTDLPIIHARMATELNGRNADWTQFIYGTLENNGDTPVFRSLKEKSRLRSMAEAQAIVAIPEGKTKIEANAIVPVQWLE